MTEPATATAAPRPRRRTSVKRRAVIDMLASSDHFRSAQQLYLELAQHHPTRIALTTVYRILHALSDEQIAETQRSEDGELLYRRRTGSEHHHYLICRRCGRAVAFIPTGIERHTIELAERYQYADVTHHVDLYGTCRDCLGKAQR